MTLKPSFELSAASTPEYLAARGFDPATVQASVLAGGVSNIVLLATHPGGRMVLKQALPQLRVEQEWFCDISRIFHESAALKLLAPKLPAGSVPEVLFEDGPNYLFAMTAAPEVCEPWKAQLLRGETDKRIAERVAILLGKLIRESWRSAELAEQFDDISIFDQLRLDPYYERSATLHPDLRPHFEHLIACCRTRRVCLVHGDWSPKNILAHDGHAMAIDFEVIHFGDPSFDAAFLLNHLLLKSFHGIEGAAMLGDVFWTALVQEMPPEPWFENATIEHLGGLLLARMDGKSPAEYIRDPEMKNRIRAFARRLILDPPRSIQEVWERHAASN